MANVNIGGNVQDSVIVVGDNNYVYKIGDVNGGVVNIIQPSDKPKYFARPTPVVAKPRAFPTLLDRENELESIKSAVQYSLPISIFGGQGVGKTSFVRHAAHSLNAEIFPSGIVHLNASNLGLDDLLQALFDSFFESSFAYKPTQTEIILALKKIKALIFLDDLQIGRDETATLLDAAPDSVFVLSSVERAIWGEGQIVALRGLPEDDSVKLFERELSRPLAEGESDSVKRICALLKGHPLHILQAASLARETGKPLERLLKEISGTQSDDESILNANLDYMGDAEKRVVAVLAAAGGNVVSLEHLQNLLKGDNVQQAIDKLMSHGLVQANSPRFNLAGNLAATVSTVWDISSWETALLTRLIDWLNGQPAQALVEESSALIIHSIQKAGEKNQWREVIKLGRALEKFMILLKRWQSWSDILKLILTAAKALNDRKTEAWVLHQLGSRAMCLGIANEARAFLSQALNLRKAIGDPLGLSVTQHNLNVLNNIVLPPKATNSGCKRAFMYGCGGAIALSLLMGFVVLLFILFANSGNNPPPTEKPFIRPTESYTPTQTRTPTIPPNRETTFTPSATTTSTPSPILLYDFVARANEAEWRQQYVDGSNTLDFFKEPQYPSPEYYLGNISDGWGYVGWDFNVPMIKEREQKQVILAYPYYQYNQVIGFYTPYFDKAVPNAYLEILVGYKDVNTAEPVGVTFRIYANENLVFEEFCYQSNNPTAYKPNVPVYIFEGANVFSLEVEAREGGTVYDYPIWAIVRLWDTGRK